MRCVYINLDPPKLYQSGFVNSSPDRFSDVWMRSFVTGDKWFINTVRSVFFFAALIVTRRVAGGLGKTTPAQKGDNQWLFVPQTFAHGVRSQEVWFKKFRQILLEK